MSVPELLAEIDSYYRSLNSTHTDDPAIALYAYELGRRMTELNILVSKAIENIAEQQS